MIPKAGPARPKARRLCDRLNHPSQASTQEHASAADRPISTAPAVDFVCPAPIAGGSRAASRTGDVACERPADERVGVPVPHAMLRLQVPYDLHVLLEATARDDLLPLRDRSTVLLLDGREIGCGSGSRPGRRLLGHGDVLLSVAPVLMRLAGRVDLTALAIDRCREPHGET